MTNKLFWLNNTKNICVSLKYKETLFGRLHRAATSGGNKKYGKWHDLKNEQTSVFLTTFLNLLVFRLTFSLVFNNMLVFRLIVSLFFKQLLDNFPLTF